MSNSYIFMDNTNFHVLHCITEDISLETMSIFVKYTCSAFPRTACSWSILQYAFLIIEIMFLSSKAQTISAENGKRQVSLESPNFMQKSKQSTIRKENSLLLYFVVLLGFFVCLFLFVRKMYMKNMDYNTYNSSTSLHLDTIPVWNTFHLASGLSLRGQESIAEIPT